MKVKRVLSFVLALSMGISAALFGAGAAENPQSPATTALLGKGAFDLAGTGSDDTVYTSGLYQYKILDDGTAEIVKSQSEYVPSVVDGLTVTSIGESAFLGQSMTSLTIPSTIVRIGRRAFHKCESLKKVTLPKTLKYIGEHAFTSTDLYQVFVPNNIDLDYSDAYTPTNGFKSDGRPFYSYNHFNGNGKVFDMTRSYCGDSWLISERFTEPDCERRHLPAMQFICLDQPDGTVYIWYATTLVDTEAEFTVPTMINGKKVSGIKNVAFHNIRRGWTDPRTDYELEKGYLSKAKYYDSNGNRKYFDYDADYYFGNKTLNFTLDGDAAVEPDTFYGNVKLHITGDKDIPEGNFANQQHLTELTIGDGVTNIGAHAFENCNDLKSVTIAKSVKSIGEHAFGYYGYNLKIKDLTVYGYRRTAAEQYAKDNGFNFVSIIGDAFPLYIAGEQITYDNCDAIPVSSGSASYDPIENILYLNNAVIDTGDKMAQGATFGMEGMKVVVTGNCKIIGRAVNGIKLTRSATITGSGTLTVIGENTGISLDGGEDDDDIRLTVDHTTLNVSGKNGLSGGSVTKNKKLSVIGSDVTVNGETSAVNYMGAIDIKAAKITVPGNAEIKSTATWDGSPSLGVYSGEELAKKVVFAPAAVVLVGDVDLSGAVTNRDAVLLDRYIAGWSGYAAMIKSMDAADIDRKNGVTNRDAVLLDRYIAGWTGYDVYIITL